MKRTDIDFQASALDSYELTARIGELGAPDGQTEVVLRGDGTFLASQRSLEEKQAREARSKLELAQVEFVMRSASQFDWSDRFPPRPGIPDEAVVYLSIKGPNGQDAHTRMWLRDAEKGTLTGPVLTVLRQALERSSDGRMFL